MDTASALAALAALGQETRLEIFRMLVQAAPEGVAAGEVAHRLGAVQNTVSAHLKVLHAAGLIRPRREGRSVRYSADMAGLGDLLSYLIEDCCRGSPELCRPVIEAIACGCGEDSPQLKGEKTR